jgi:hypothetical protein
MPIDFTMLAIKPEPAEKQSDQWTNTQIALPGPGKEVLYRTKVYQSFGRLGEDGQWYSAKGCRETWPVLFWRNL